jgi:hypothetical protein
LEATFVMTGPVSDIGCDEQGYFNDAPRAARQQ